MKNPENIEAVYIHTCGYIFTNKFIDTCLLEKAGLFFHTQNLIFGNKS